MTVEDNKLTALRMIEQIGKGILDESLITSDICWWVPGMGIVPKQKFLEIMSAFGSLTKGDCQMTVKGITAEDDRVAIEAESYADLINGETYQNTYHFLFLFENGKIKMAKEYNDSRYAAEVLAAAGGLG